MDDLQLLLSLAGTTIGFLITTLTFLTKFITNVKAKKAALEIIKITSALIPYIEEAEKFTHYTGEEKKAYVTTKATQLIINNKMKISEEKISDTIEELVALTKKVNISSNPSKKDLQKLYV